MEEVNKKILNLKALKPLIDEDTTSIPEKGTLESISQEEETPLNSEISPFSSDTTSEVPQEEAESHSLKKLSLSSLSGKKDATVVEDVDTEKNIAHVTAEIQEEVLSPDIKKEKIIGTTNEIQTEDEALKKDDIINLVKVPKIEEKTPSENKVIDEKKAIDEIIAKGEKKKEEEDEPKKKMLVLQKMFGRKEEVEVKTPEEIEQERIKDEQKQQFEEEKRLDAEKNKVDFQNYESGFKKKSNNVIKRIQNFKYSPRTRAGLLIGLIAMCIIVIGSLMIFMPERHSLSLYKASILNITGIQTPETPNPYQEGVIQEPTATEEVVTDTQSGSEAEEIIDTSIPEENTSAEINTGNNQTTKERLREHLLKKYANQ